MPTAPGNASAAPSSVHGISYDYYGRRVATCSSDGMICVYDEAGHKTGEWRAHNGSCFRVVWAHPEFGPVLASCSFDRKVCVWEEASDAEDPAPHPRPAGGWRLAAELQQARDSLHDVAFAPHVHGLWLASCGDDRLVRVYEAPDVMRLSEWLASAEFEASGETKARAAEAPGQRGAAPQCLAWNPSHVEPMALALGLADGSVHVWGVSERAGSWVRDDASPLDASPGQGRAVRDTRAAPLRPPRRRASSCSSLAPPAGPASRPTRSLTRTACAASPGRRTSAGRTTSSPPPRGTAPSSCGSCESPRPSRRRRGTAARPEAPPIRAGAASALPSSRTRGRFGGWSGTRAARCSPSRSTRGGCTCTAATRRGTGSASQAPAEHAFRVEYHRGAGRRGGVSVARQWLHWHCTTGHCLGAR
uniref:Uncharacterized protein n=1 Tax=Emiliania huxleyi TaxID=2903 RepID=A0A7S3TWT4_EMIHU